MVYKAQNPEGQSTPQNLSGERAHNPRKSEWADSTTSPFSIIKNIPATAITISSQFLQGLTWEREIPSSIINLIKHFPLDAYKQDWPDQYP